MKRVLLFLLVGMAGTLNAQTILATKTGQISFFSSTSVEDIDAVNNEVSSLLNPATGDLVFAVLMKSFHFKKALMEEHFNENYVESSKFPKATFSGKIVNLATVNFSKDGTYPVEVEGDLTMHGVKQHVKVPGKLEIAGGIVTSTSEFEIVLADYQVEIPKLVADKIAKSIKVKVKCIYAAKK